MKKLESSNLQSISGGSWIGGFCAGVGVVSVLGFVNPAITVAVIGCAGYGVYSAFN